METAISENRVDKFRRSLQVGRLIWIPQTDEDGNDSGFYAEVTEKYTHTVLLRYDKNHIRTTHRMSPSYIQLMMMLKEAR